MTGPLVAKHHPSRWGWALLALGLGALSGCEPTLGKACGGLTGGSCNVGEFCNFTPDSLCGAADQTGTCEQVPQQCGAIYAPVCGCDGRTYGNACDANLRGMAVAKNEPCEPVSDAGQPDATSGGESDAGASLDGAAPGPDASSADASSSQKWCGGFAGLTCAAGQFCNYERAAGGLGCGVADGSGVCQDIPQGCTLDYNPVCGCDGKTYPNACAAHAAGASVAQAGECGAPKKVSCDHRAVLCKRAEPACPAGQVAAVEGTCFGACVPIDQCTCSDAPECPHEGEYTCHRHKQRCGPYVN